MVTMWKLSSYGRNIEIQHGRHIIIYAVFKERQMPLTLSVVTEKVVIGLYREIAIAIQKKVGDSNGANV